MPWARFEANYPFHPKVASLSEAAFRVHVTSVCVGVLNKTGMRLTSGTIKVIMGTLNNRRRAKAALAELLQAGLFEADPENPDSYLIHDFLDYNPGPEQKLRERELNRERQRRYRERRSNAVSNAVTNDDVTDPHNERPSPSLPYQEDDEDARADGGGSELGAKGNGAPAPRGCGRCEKFGARIGFNPNTGKPCACPLGLWRVREKARTGRWPVGPDRPGDAPAEPLKRRRPGTKLSPQEQAEFDKLVEETLKREQDKDLDQELPL